jgi:hypothetical protein
VDAPSQAKVNAVNDMQILISLQPLRRTSGLRFGIGTLQVTGAMHDTGGKWQAVCARKPLFG